MSASSEYRIDNLRKNGLADNFRVTEAGLELRGGTRHALSFTDRIRAVLPVTDGQNEKLYVFAGDTLYLVCEDENGLSTESLGVPEQIAFADELEKVELFMFTGKLYILGGGNYYCYDGNSIAIVEGYIPLISRYTKAIGVGVEYESENLLTDKVRVRFCPDSSSKTFRLRGQVKSIDRVIINGFETTDYVGTVGRNASVSFDVTYTESENDLIEVYYTRDVESSRSMITSCRHAAVYGGDTDTRVFLYGGEDQSKLYPSEPTDAKTAEDGGYRSISGEYFPADRAITVADGNQSINGAVRQFDRLAIFTRDGAYYTYPHYDGKINGVERYSFPILPLNSEVGATFNGGAALVENEPYALNPTGLYRFKSTSVRDERLAIRIDVPDGFGLDRDFIENAYLYVNRMLGELWCVYRGCILIYNARLEVWYKFTGIEPELLFDFNNETGFAIGEKLFFFDDELTTDELSSTLVPIAAGYESDWLDLSAPFERKVLYGFAIELSSALGASIDAVLTDGHGCEVHRSFTVDKRSEAPTVFRTHTRLGRFDHLKLRLQANAGTEKLALYGMKFIFG